MSGGEPGRVADDNGPFLIGIDGGGTKTEAVIGRRIETGDADHNAAGCSDPFAGLQILARGTAGPANLQSVSADQAWHQCRTAIVAAFDSLHLPVGQIDAVALAMAGEGSRPHREAFVAVVQRVGLAARVIVTHDARPLIAAGTPNDCGVALIAGTGSFAYCRTAEGVEDRCGGWGYLYGDEGSGYAIAAAGLRAAVRAADGRGEPTDLLTAFGHWLDEPTATAWLPRLRTWNPEQLAGGAKVVLEVAARGDAVANALIDRAADHLARHLKALWDRRFAGKPVNLALTGGLLIGDPTLRERVLNHFVQRGGVVGEYRVITHPVDTVLTLLR